MYRQQLEMQKSTWYLHSTKRCTRCSSTWWNSRNC